MAYIGIPPPHVMHNLLRHITLSAAIVAAYASAAEVKVAFSGGERAVLEYTPERSTGLDAIYVAYDASSLASMVITPADGTLSVSRYSNLGGGYAQPVSFRSDGGNAVVDNPEGDMGYIIESGGRSTYIWIVDYSRHPMQLSGLRGAEPQECDNTRLEVQGVGEAIYYYTIDGRRCELARDIEVKYNSLEWSDDAEGFIQVALTRTLPHLTPEISVTPPIYCSTVFAISGDRFLKAWDMEKHLESTPVPPNGIASHTSAEQTNLPDEGEEAEPSNVIKTEVAGIGGSAPVDVSFRAWVTDAVVHNEWQVATDEQFDNIDCRFNEQNLDYTFTGEGTYYVRYVGSNADGSCETYGETYTVGIGSSELKIPNAFTPNEDGVNDVWKVAYRSLISFSCSIFDRYGTQLFHFSDPSQGWDGKYKGKYVKPGVYFYVIEAKGADGRSYKKGGDINIIKSKRYESSGGSAENPVTPEE